MAKLSVQKAKAEKQKEQDAKDSTSDSLENLPELEKDGNEDSSDADEGLDIQLLRREAANSRTSSRA